MKITAEGYEDKSLRSIRGVYSFTFPNGKKYVGITYGSGNFGNRFSNHLKSVRKGSNYPIHNAIRKYGWENIKKEIILVTDDIERSKRLETQLVAFWKLNIKRFGDEAKGYNLTDGGDGCSGPSGTIPKNKGITGIMHHTEESKKLISARSKEMWKDGTHTKAKQQERNKKLLINNPNHYKDLAILTRKANKVFNYIFYFDDGRVETPNSWREYIRDTLGNENLTHNIQQLLKGKRTRVHNIVRVIKYGLDGNLIKDSLIEREKFILKQKDNIRKPCPGSKYLIQEPSGEEIEIQNLSSYCKEKSINISSLMRKYKGTCPGVSGYKIIKKITNG